MNENADKHLDHLSRKVIGKSAIERPSLDFTKDVMSHIKGLSTSKVTTYVPLISKRVWSMIAIICVGVIGYVVFGTSDSETTIFSSLGLERFTTFEINNPLASVEFSQTLIYAVLLFAVMMCVQIPILKRYFDKRYEA
ncbi:DUF6688 domain-containing protein [Psychroserpens luteolus]|uniref:DUF6688 domain-containing protein n=1 Tax=Psychroserpens luteolus TaxID=2855840 RepID=UPI001E578088|nr:hypothetical protein [Psychroserpens luteolus]MCD2259997.1 hypothetical protein [Psychroserpens luteolus]